MLPRCCEMGCEKRSRVKAAWLLAQQSVISERSSLSKVSTFRLQKPSAQ